MVDSLGQILERVSNIPMTYFLAQKQPFLPEDYTTLYSPIPLFYNLP